MTGRAVSAGVACAVVGALAAAAIAAGNAVHVRRVSRDPYVNTTSYHATEVEPDTFSFGRRIVAAFQVGRFAGGGASNIGWSTSSDAGRTWRHGFLPKTTAFATPKGRFARESDPAVAYDAAHRTWLISGLAISTQVEGVAVIVSRSTDDGLKWSSPVTVATATARQFFDKDWVTCDDTPTSPHYGSCYVEWDDAANRGQLHMAYSRDGASRWARSRVPTAGVVGGQPVVEPDGHVVMPIDDAVGSVVESFLSTNGGVSYTGPTHIATVFAHAERGDLRSPALPTAGVDEVGRVYVAWADCRFRSSCSANDIVFSTSKDGKRWTSVRRVPIDPTTSGVDHFLPGLGVATNTSGAKGRLGLTYYYYPRTRCTVATCRLDVGFVSSSDGGARWSPPVRLAGPTRMNELPLTSQGYMVGDYISTSLMTGVTGDPALPVFAVGMPVAGKRCAVGDVASCDEPMEAPSRALRTPRARTRPTVQDPVLNTRAGAAMRSPLSFH